MLILIKFARCRSMATSALFRWVRRGPTSRFWCSLLCHTSIRWYIRRFRPRLRVSVTVESCGTIAVSLHGSKVHPEEPPRLIGNQYSQRATTARFQWFSTTEPVSRKIVPTVRVFYRRGARSALTSRVVRIRRAGSSPVRQPAGDKRIYHQLLGSGRRCSTIAKVSTAAWPG